MFTVYSLNGTDCCCIKYKSSTSSISGSSTSRHCQGVVNHRIMLPEDQDLFRSEALDHFITVTQKPN